MAYCGLMYTMYHTKTGPVIVCLGITIITSIIISLFLLLLLLLLLLPHSFLLWSTSTISNQISIPTRHSPPCPRQMWAVSINTSI